MREVWTRLGPQAILCVRFKRLRVFRTILINITAAWAVDREFVIYIFLGVVGPMVPPGSPDALGKAKTKVSLGFSRFEAKNNDFPLVF